MSQYLIDAIGNTPNVDVRYSTEVSERRRGSPRAPRASEHGGVRDGDGRRRGTRRADRRGAHTEWLPDEIALDDWGYVITGTAAGAVRPLETSLPGVFAAGDVRADSVERVAR